jgi:hypothetical protein
MKMKKIKYIIFTLLTAFILSSCNNEIDAVENLNNPDRNQVLANGSDLLGIVRGGYVTWWQANNRDLVPPLAVAADHATCSWGNWGMRALSNEPRNPIQNSSSWSDLSVLEQPWAGNYSSISSSNDVLGAIEDGIKWIDGDEDLTPVIEGAAYLLRGLSYGYLGLLFEKGFIVNVGDDLTQTFPFVGYKDLINQAVDDLDRTIAVASDNEITIPNTVINGVDLNSEQLIKLCNSFKARFIVQGARNLDETNTIDWNEIKSFAQNGITEDFGPLGDDGISWWSNIDVLMESSNGFGAFGARLDMRVINKVDPDQPVFFPAGSGSTLENPEISTNDNRFGEGKDFEYRPDILFRSERGRFHFSHYIHTRFMNDDNFSDGNDSKQIKSFMLEDNRLLLAEAKARLNELDNVSGAAYDLNQGSRVNRGNLSPLLGTESKDEILEAIFYERYIELFNTGVGSGFFDRRRTNQLQIGTFRHFPVPSTELEVLEEQLYTLGGVDADPSGTEPHYNLGSENARTDETNIPTFN